MSSHTVTIDGMSCAHCVQHVTRALASVAGIEVHEVTIGGARITAPDGAALQAALAAVDAAGYPARLAGAPPPTLGIRLPGERP
jgi:copper chaperone